MPACAISPANRREQVRVVGNELDSAWFEFDFNLSWLEFPGIDFSIFDFIDF